MKYTYKKNGCEVRTENKLNKGFTKRDIISLGLRLTCLEKYIDDQNKPVLLRMIAEELLHTSHNDLKKMLGDAGTIEANLPEDIVEIGLNALESILIETSIDTIEEFNNYCKNELLLD